MSNSCCYQRHAAKNIDNRRCSPRRSQCKATQNGKYTAKPSSPAKGYTAYFIEMTFPSTGKMPFKFTSGVVVTPDTYPSGPPVPGKTKLGAVPARGR